MSSVPLTQAVSSGDADAVSAMLANGVDVNERTGGGQTPLILATIFGHTHLIPLLLEAGADPQLRDNLGLNALEWAQRRGATEVLEVLTNKPKRTPKPELRPPAPLAPTEPAPNDQRASEPRPMSSAEKSERWLSGLKQRIAEASQGEPTERPSIFGIRTEPEVTVTAPPEPTPEPLPPPTPEPPPPPIPEPAPRESVPQISQSTQTALKVDEQVAPPKPKRKRCPKCNSIYNSDLVAYCAHHFVPLVDADDAPIISEPPKTSPVLFWMIIVITLTGSLVIGSLITAYFLTSNKAAPTVASSPPTPVAVQKGSPVVGHELEGKVVSLPVAECPLNGQEAIPGTVVVRVVIGKTGQVTLARPSGGDWLLRRAASEAAMKSTFAPEKLRGRETEGTITYTFEP